MKEIRNQRFEEERSLYGIKNTIIDSCVFNGAADGESPLKEARNIEVRNSIFKLRYPIWHIEDSIIINSTFTESSRAPFWYSKNVKIIDTKVDSVKFLRECSNIDIVNSVFNSQEFGWKTNNINMKDSSVKCEYIFFDSSNINLDNFKLDGKYSFQYVKNLNITNSILNTKDAFWHTMDAVIENTTIKGEYLAWYSKNLTFKNCKIIGTQPFCYSENITLINCEMEECDFAFENTSVNADITTDLISIKNPHKGVINSKGVKEIIINEYKWPGKVVINGKTIK